MTPERLALCIEWLRSDYVPASRAFCRAVERGDHWRAGEAERWLALAERRVFQCAARLPRAQGRELLRALGISMRRVTLRGPLTA